MVETKLTYKQKKELAEWLALKNNGAITGSIMLRERGIDLGREPDDIDIVISESLEEKDILLPPLVYDKQNDERDGYSVFVRCWFLGTKIEFIQDDNSLERAYENIGSAPYCLVEDLVNAKKEYIEQDSNLEYIDKCKRDINIIESHQKQFPIVIYKVLNNGFITKLVCNTMMGDSYMFAAIKLMDCECFGDWKIKDSGRIEYYTTLQSLPQSDDYFTDFEKAKKVSKERYDNIVCPHGKYRVVRYFDDCFDRYETDLLSKREAYEQMDKFRKRKTCYYSYDVKLIENQ